MTKYFLIERWPSQGFVLYTSPFDGETDKVRIATMKTGPFESLGEVSKYLSQNALQHGSYEIEAVREANP